MATNNSVNTSLSGQTGTGNFVGATSPTLVTPTLGNATATSLAFSPTTGGIVGTTTNDNAGSGKVGEYVSASVLVGSAVAFTVSGTSYTVTSISLTAGDWDVTATGFTNPAAGTVTQSAFFGISTTAATLPTAASGNNAAGFGNDVTAANAFFGITIGPQRISLSGTTTVYLVGNSNFTVSTMSGYGFISARRVR